MAEGASNVLAIAAAQYEVAQKCQDTDLVDCALRTVACTPDTIITGSSRPKVKAWKIAEAELVVSATLQNLGASGSTCVEAGRDGHTVAVASDDGHIGVWDLRATSRPTSTIDCLASIASKVKFLREGLRLVAGGPSGQLSFWDLRMSRMECQVGPAGLVAPSDLKGDDKSAVKRLKRDPQAAAAALGAGDTDGRGASGASPIYSLAVSRDGTFIAVGRGSGTVGVLRLNGLDWAGDVAVHMPPQAANGQPPQSPAQRAAPVRALTFDPHSKLLLSGGDDHHVCLFEAASWARRASKSQEVVTRLPQPERFMAHQGLVTSASVCPIASQRLLVTTSWDSVVKVWDYATHRLVCSFTEHEDGVFDSAFSPASTDSFFVTVGGDAKVVLYKQKPP